MDGRDDRREVNTTRRAVTSARLHKVVCEHIVPRLAFIHRERKWAHTARPPTSEEIDEFVTAILAPEPAPADDFFQRMLERGLTVDALFDTLLEPTARRLGELWADDVCDFVDVTIGVNRLRVMLEAHAYELEACSCAPARIDDPRRRALLIATPQEQHRFGLDVVATFLRASGWDTTVEVRQTAKENAATAAVNWFAVAGVTIGDKSRIAEAARAIAAVRRASLNPSIAVIVGGVAVQGRPDLVVRLGADAIAEDGPTAVLLAERLALS
jgi:methanogenic corrinoid protein MtbC1